MTKRPSFTVVIPVYNCQQFIKESIDSALQAGANHNIEVIVIDDGSTDLTPKILEEYRGTITVISQPNTGEAAAVNEGIIRSKGDLICILSADDRLVGPETFEGLVELFESNRDLIAAYADWRMINQDGLVMSEIRLPDYSQNDLIGKSWCIPGPGTFFRKSVAIKVGGRDTSFRYVSDFDFWLRLSQQGTFSHRQIVAAEWRNHDGSTTISGINHRMFTETWSVMKNFLFTHPQEKSLMKRALGNAYINSAMLKVKNSRLPGREYVFRAFLESPKTVLLERFWDSLVVLFLPASLKFLGRRY